MAKVHQQFIRRLRKYVTPSFSAFNLHFLEAKLAMQNRGEQANALSTLDRSPVRRQSKRGMNELAVELHILIALELPQSSLLNLACVSKGWFVSPQRRLRYNNIPLFQTSGTG